MSKCLYDILRSWNKLSKISIKYNTPWLNVQKYNVTQYLKLIMVINLSLKHKLTWKFLAKVI